MIAPFHRGLITAFALALPTLSFAQAHAPDLEVTAHAAVTTVAPGEPFEVAISFDVPEDWHLYWDNPGESGMPPTVEWTLPSGFAAGPLRFPIPKEHESSGIVTNILEGKVNLLTKMTPPDDLTPGGRVLIKGDVRWLVCKEACFPGSGEIKIELKTGSGVEVDSDNELLFKIASRQLPQYGPNGKHVSISARTSKAQIQKGDTFEVHIDVDIKRGFHIQSNKPLGEFYVPTAVFPRTVEGLSFEQAIFPEPHIRNDRALGKVSEFDGKITVKLPVRVTGPTPTEEVILSGLYKYQACNDKGQCYPAEAVTWSTTVRSLTVAAHRPATSDAVAQASPAATSAAMGNDADMAEDAEDSEAPSTTGATSGPGPTSAGADAQGLYFLLGKMLAGFLGGLILNIMPCVLPVISIKILSFVQQADEHPRRVFHLGMTFAAGIVVSFWVLAGGILALRSQTGLERGWGAFLQEPKFIIAMASLMFVFALSLFGVFEIVLPGTAASKLGGAAEREGFSGAFAKGVLATLLATPCTAPFLGPAIAFALASSTLNVMLVFTAAGVGMAFPYVLLTARPAWMRYLPKPGTWMVTFKQFMGFLLIATVVWLLWILAGLQTGDEVIWTLLFLMFLAVACWIYGKVLFSRSAAIKVLGYASAMGCAGFGGWYSYLYTPEEINWRSYEPGLAESLANAGYTVYVDYTARWCVTCQTNKKLVLHSRVVRSRFDRDRIVPIKADYTNYDPLVGEDLKRYGRDAVPLNVVLPANNPEDAIVLPVILTKSSVLEALTEAGPSAVQEPLEIKTPVVAKSG